MRPAQLRTKAHLAAAAPVAAASPGLFESLRMTVLQAFNGVCSSEGMRAYKPFILSPAEFCQALSFQHCSFFVWLPLPLLLTSSRSATDLHRNPSPHERAHTNADNAPFSRR